MPISAEVEEELEEGHGAGAKKVEVREDLSGGTEPTGGGEGPEEKLRRP